MYLTRTRLDMSKRKTLLALSSPAIFHGAIELLFENKQERNLWRIDTLDNNTYLLLLSAAKPDMTPFINQFGVEREEAITKSYESLTNRVKEDSIWRFRLVANPTHTIKTEKGRGKVVAHITDAHQLQWMKSKASSNGFEIVDDICYVLSSEWKVFYKNGYNMKSSYHKVRMLQVTYEGVLKIVDSEAMNYALIHGIGRGKAYGSGLLTIASI